jgi:broad specificity phosphatase PhoE
VQVLSEIVVKNRGFWKNTYFALRHGKSVANVRRLIVSHPDHALKGYGLAEEGRKQVMDSIDEALHEGVLDDSMVIFSSDFLRTKETACIAADILGLKEKDIIFTHKLRERFFGDWDKTSSLNYEKVWHDDAVDHIHKNGNVESVTEVLERASSLVKEIEQQFSARNILLVSHGDVLAILQTFFASRQAGEHRSLSPLDTGMLRKLGG